MSSKGYLSAAETLRKNPQQWEAYEAKQNCVVLAGPGSGKTRVLTIKVAQVLAEEIRRPRGLACITYNNECVREIRNRLDRLGVERRPNLLIGTVHSFCFNAVVRPYAKLAGVALPDPLAVARDDARKAALSKALTDLELDERAADWGIALKRYRWTHVDRSAPDWTEDGEVSALVEQYEANLRAQGCVDFDDMILIALDIVKKHEWVRRALHARFPMLVVDEYQDLGLPLHEIVRALCWQGRMRLLAVGDPDQSIYGFTGARPELLRELAAQPGVLAVQLKKNYRCGKRIVRGAAIALGEAREYEAAGEHEGVIRLVECVDGIEEQAEQICGTIIPSLLDRLPGTRLGDLAVLYIDKYDAAVITKTVKKHGLDYIGGDKDVRYTETPLTRWLQDCAGWSAGGWKEDIPRLSDLLTFWHDLGHRSSGADRRASTRELVRFLWAHRDPEMVLPKWLAEFMDAGLSAAVASAVERPDEQHSLDELRSAAEDPEKLSDFTVAAFGGLKGSSKHLNLITLHSSKGSEFDAVILMGMEQGRLPRWNASADAKREARRLFYVGLTRAKHEVFLTYSGWYEARGRRFDNGASEFLRELEDVANEA